MNLKEIIESQYTDQVGILHVFDGNSPPTYLQ